MRARFKRRKVPRTAGIATMLTAAGLLIAGCDFTNVRSQGDDLDVAIKRSASDALIWNCTAEPGPGRDRAGCVLANIRALCNTWPQQGWDLWRCLRATSDEATLRLDMEYAIQAVISPLADCLAVDMSNQDQWAYDWYGASGGFCDSTYP